jgi:uncharacterized protein YgiB involved in biofilm formation
LAFPAVPPALGATPSSVPRIVISDYPMNPRLELAIVASVAATVLAGCSGSQRKDCVDQNGFVLPDARCTGRSTYAAGGAYPRFIYGGQVRSGKIVGGSTTAPAVSRGGFGGARSSFGG